MEKEPFSTYAIKAVLMILLCIFMPEGIYAQSNEGREFWLGFMEHKDKGENDMVVMITSRVATSGTISIPNRDFNEEFTVAANDVTVIALPAYAETIGSEFVNDNAIHITSAQDISVYMHQYFGMRSEASVVLPKSTIGNSYYIISFTGVEEGSFGPGIFPSEFLIVANHDDTTIEYSPEVQTQGGALLPAGPRSITLDKGEVYQVRALNPLDDLTGSFVSGDKNFSLYAGTSWSQVPLGCTAMDNLLEQMYPISTWGTRYVASPFINTSLDLYRVIASEDNTEVDVQGSFVAATTLNAGDFFDFPAEQGAFIQATKPISVAQYIVGSNCNGGVGDPSMVILNTVEQIRDTVTLYNSNFFDIEEQYINVICKAGEEGLVFIDNAQVISLGVNFQTIDDAGEFAYATIPTEVGAHTLFTQGCGIIAMAYGYGDIESYAYSGGASFTDINENPIPEGGCLNDTIAFATGLPPDRYNVRWDLGDGTITEEHSFEHQYSGLGSFPLSLIVDDICFNEIDTIYRDLMVTLREDIVAIDDQAGCVGTTITLGAVDLAGARFEWSGPNDYISEDQYPEIQNITTDEAGLYEVVGNISGCKTIPVSLAVEVWENPTPYLGEDTVLCTLDGDILTLSAGDYNFYTWNDSSTDPIFDVTTEGDFSVIVEDNNGCLGQDSIFIQRQCPTRFYIPNVFSPNGDSMNDGFGVFGIELISMKLSIYDRWGEQVFFSEDENILWDGKFEGQNAIGGEYIWILEYEGYLEDATTFSDTETGTILLVR